MSEIRFDDRGREQVKAWYTLVVYPGRELRIRDKLLKLAQNEQFNNQIFRVMVPAIKEPNQKGKLKEKLIYTQYVYIEMILNDHTYHSVKIDGVRHILGEPTPVPEHEIKEIFKMIGEKYSHEIDIKVGDIVQITDKEHDSFFMQKGQVLEINKTKEEVTIGIELFGKTVPAKLKIDQVTKIKKN